MNLAQFYRSRCKYLHISAQLVRVPHYSESGALLHVSVEAVRPGHTYSAGLRRIKVTRRDRLRARRMAQVAAVSEHRNDFERRWANWAWREWQRTGRRPKP